MPRFDLSLPDLQTYQPVRTEPADFDAFWTTTPSEAQVHPLEARFEPMDAGLATLETFEVTFLRVRRSIH